MRLPDVKRQLALFGLLALSSAPGLADDQPAAPARKRIDVPQLFATTCGWCHSDGGRAAGKGPQLMNTKRSDDFIRNRIKNGKEGTDAGVRRLVFGRRHRRHPCLYPRPEARLRSALDAPRHRLYVVRARRRRRRGANAGTDQERGDAQRLPAGERNAVLPPHRRAARISGRCRARRRQAARRLARRGMGDLANSGAARQLRPASRRDRRRGGAACFASGAVETLLSQRRRPCRAARARAEIARRPERAHQSRGAWSARSPRWC